MKADLRKGWCPGALRPMMARDGLIVRLRLSGGIVTASVAHALADLAARHGNGIFDLSARGNLQMRGITAASLPAVQDGLRRLGLLDADPAAEAVRNVIASPLAGLHGGPDVRPLGIALETRLAGDKALHALPGKFGFLIDDGTLPSLAAIAADVRFDWIAEAALFSIGLGGTRSTALRVGARRAEDVVEAAALAARGAIDLFATVEARRMRDLVEILGPVDVATRCGDARPNPVPAPIEPTMAAGIVGWHTFDGITTLGLAVPFGRLDAAMLRGAADLAASAGRDEIRLTPWRTILVPLHASAVVARKSEAIGGFITDPHDPRLAVAACVGIAGCERGTTRTHDDATALADLAARLGEAGTPLHVSGCEKGCAKPSRTRVTLVGRDGRYDLVRDGRAGDRPLLRELDRAAARSALASLLEPA
jgi:precorrin-3B synthase